MDAPILSISIITYNQEKYIREAIDGVINQKHDYKYELIISDDCSSDKTPQIIKEYEEKYPDIIVGVYNDKNLGAMKNYYSALKRCRGKYIMVCGGDDYFLDGKIKKQVDFMETHPDIGMVSAYAKVLNEKTHRFEKILYGSKDVSYEHLLHSNELQICAATVCFRRDIFFDYLNKINPEERDWKAEDYPFWLWVSLKSKIEFQNDILVVYRKVPGSISHSRDIKKSLLFVRSLYEIIYFFTVDDRTRRLVKNNYNRELSNVFYNYGRYNDALRYAQKCEWDLLPLNTKLKFLSLYFPGIRMLLAFFYKKWFNIL